MTLFTGDFEEVILPCGTIIENPLDLDIVNARICYTCVNPPLYQKIKMLVVTYLDVKGYVKQQWAPLSAVRLVRRNTYD